MVTRSWTHLGRVDDQTHERGHEHGPGQLLPPQLRLVQRQTAGMSRHRHRVGVSQRRHGAPDSIRSENYRRWVTGSVLVRCVCMCVCIAQLSAAEVGQRRCAWEFLPRDVNAPSLLENPPVMPSGVVGNIMLLEFLHAVNLKKF